MSVLHFSTLLHSKSVCLAVKIISRLNTYRDQRGLKATRTSHTRIFVSRSLCRDIHSTCLDWLSMEISSTGLIGCFVPSFERTSTQAATSPISRRTSFASQWESLPFRRMQITVRTWPSAKLLSVICKKGKR